MWHVCFLCIWVLLLAACEKLQRHIEKNLLVISYCLRKHALSTHLVQKLDFFFFFYFLKGIMLPRCFSGKESACQITESGRSPGGGNGNPLQYACLENPMERAAWRAAVHEVTKSQIRLSDFTFFLSCIFRNSLHLDVLHLFKGLIFKNQCPPQFYYKSSLALYDLIFFLSQLLWNILYVPFIQQLNISCHIFYFCLISNLIIL